MNILKYLIAFWLCAVIINAHAKDLYQIETSQGTLSLAKKKLSEADSTWAVKLDKKILWEFESEGISKPYFMTVTGNGSDAYDQSGNSTNSKAAILDFQSEIMAIVVKDFMGNACGGNGGYDLIFVAYLKADGTFKHLDVPTDGCTIVNKASTDGKKLILAVAEYAKPLVFESGQLKTLAVPAPPIKTVYEDLNASEKAFKCVKEARGECPYFSEVYKGDAGFRESLDSALKESGFTNPVLGDDSMDSSSTPIIISGEPYIYDDTWRKFSESPGSDRIEVLYSLQQKRAVGLFYVEDSEKGKWFGNPTDLEKRVLDEAKNLSGSNPIGKAVSEGPYPVIVK